MRLTNRFSVRRVALARVRPVNVNWLTKRLFFLCRNFKRWISPPRICARWFYCCSHPRTPLCARRARPFSSTWRNVSHQVPYNDEHLFWVAAPLLIHRSSFRISWSSWTQLLGGERFGRGDALGYVTGIPFQGSTILCCSLPRHLGGTLWAHEHSWGHTSTYLSLSLFRLCEKVSVKRILLKLDFLPSLLALLKPEGKKDIIWKYWLPFKSTAWCSFRRACLYWTGILHCFSFGW